MNTIQNCTHDKQYSNKSFQIPRSFQQPHFSKKRPSKNPEASFSLYVYYLNNQPRQGTQDWPENNFLAKFVRLSRETRKKRRGTPSSSFVGDEASRWSAESATGAALIYFVRCNDGRGLYPRLLSNRPSTGNERRTLRVRHPRLSNYPRLQEGFVREIRRNEFISKRHNGARMGNKARNMLLFVSKILFIHC